MEFGILGPLEVTSDGRSLDLGGAKQRSLLAVLLLNANEVVSHDRLIDALWEDQPPESAQKALQVYVSGLRKAIGRDRLQTKAPGYLLRVHAGELDLGRFSALQREGRPAEALSLWRGPPLSDFAYQRFAQAEIGRLEELRLACLEEWVEQRLQARPGGELVGELEALVSEQPLRERLRAQLMLALYRSGRQAEALAAFQEARRALVDELGIEPGRELRELHQAILNQDPTLDLPLPEPAVESDRHRDSPSAEPPREPAREVRKTVTALAVAVDVSSADERPVDPEALRRVTTRAFGVVRDAVERHGGVLETPAGNAVTAVFGLPAVHEDDAARAARAAEEARELLAAISSELPAGRILEVRFRIGISTGEVLAGGGREAPLGAVGEPLTRASALAQAARAGEIAVDDATRRRLRETPRRVSPMIGRERERRRLRDAFDQAVGDGCCQLFTVLGAAGVGKSRLVEEFLAEVGGAARVVRGRCLPYGDGITYWPVLEAVKDGVGLADADSPAEAREKLLRAVDGEPAADTIAQRLSEVLGLADTATPVEEVFAAVQTLFVTLARVGPLVVVFDDVHWGEPTFLELVEYLAERTRDVPLLLVCLARPELFDSRPAWAGGKLNATTALLEPLSDDQSLQLVGNLAGASALDAGARGRIVAAAEGNPLFVEEMLALALEEDGSTDELVVPPTIQALLAARLDRLPDDERAALDRAAVQGKVFYADAVAALAPLAAAVSSCLGALVRKELIRPERPSFGGDTYRFRHLLIRDAAYDSIPKEARADLHERFARWLEEAAGERAAEYEEIVGYHLEQGFRYRQELGQVDDSARRLAGEAAARLGAAGRRAFVRSDTPAGTALTSRAVSLLPPDDPARVDLVPSVRVVQGVADLSWAERVLTEAVEAAATAGDRRLAARALVQRGLLRLFTEPEVTPAELIDTAQRAVEVFEELGDELGLARGWRLTAQAHYLDRRLEACAEASERALAYAHRSSDQFEELEIVQWLVVALLWGPVPVPEAANRLERLLEETANEPACAVQILAALALLATMSGQVDEARELTDRAHAAAGALGEWIWLATFDLAQAALVGGDPVGAEALIRPHYEQHDAVARAGNFSALSQLLADALYEQGSFDDAERLTVESERAARPNDVHDQIRWRAIRAKAIARRGAFDEAEELARAAVASAAATDFVVAHADTLMDLAEVLELRGDREGALAAAEEAMHQYERKQNAVGAARARARAGAHAR